MCNKDTDGSKMGNKSRLLTVDSTRKQFLVQCLKV